MRIGLMLRHMGRQPGGTGTYTNMMVRHMLRADSRNQYVLFYDDPSRLGTYAGQGNVEELCVRSPSKLLWDQVFVPLIARRRRIDVLFNLKLSVPLLAGCKTAFVQHGADWFVMPEQYEFMDRMYVRFFARRYWSKADAVISVSKDAERRLASIMDERTAAKLHTIYHGADSRFTATPDPAALAALRAKYQLDSPFLLYLGQIYPMKNVGGLIRAFASIRERIPHQLLIVGKAGVNSAADLALIHSLGLSDRVRHLGWVPDAEVPLFYNAAELFTFPSLYEGFGIPIIEAMASGCPVLTSTGGACPEVAGDAALLVDPQSMVSIAAGIERMLSDEPLRAGLRARGLERAREFTWDRSARQTVQLLESLVAGSRYTRSS